MLPFRLWRKALAVFLGGMLSFALWQADHFPVLGQGDEILGNSMSGAVKVVVQRGETLWSLAQKHDTKVDEIVKLNALKNPDKIRAGESIWIPDQEKEENIENTEKINKSGKERMLPETEDTNEVTWGLGALRRHFAKLEAAFLPSSGVSRQSLELVTYDIYVHPQSVHLEAADSVPENKRSNDLDAVQEQRLSWAASLETEGRVHSRGLGYAVSQGDVELLSRVIHGEARGESFEGQVAVGAVVLNRMKDPRFPDTIRGVIYQAGAFTAVADKQIQLSPNDQSYKAAEAALAGQDPTNGALFYFNPRTAKDDWIKSRSVVKRIGNHTFSI